MVYTWNEENFFEKIKVVNKIRMLQFYRFY